MNISCNPADLGTRGISAKRFLESSLWVIGPDFLKNGFSPAKLIDLSLDLEKWKVKVVLNVNLSTNYQHIKFDGVSSFTRLVCSFAFIHRFINNCKAKYELLP